MMEEATIRHEKILEIADKKHLETEDALFKQKKKYCDELDEKHMTTAADGSGIELKEYQEQYNANHDFAIF